MKLSEICTAFPSNNWNCPHPAQALPFQVRAKLRTLFGGLFSSTDRARRRAPTRTGIATRPFEAGDPFSALSMPHLIKKGEWETRVDSAPGRQRATIIFHGYEKLLYSSPQSLVNKAQLALGVAAIIEAAHDSLAQPCELIFISENNLPHAIAVHAPKLRRAQYTYIITDLLFDESGIFNSGEKLLAALTNGGIKHPVVAVVRDVYETTQTNPLEKLSVELLPYKNSTNNSLNSLYSGPFYINNLREQFSHLSKTIESARGTALLIDSNSNLVTLVEQFTQLLAARKN